MRLSALCMVIALAASPAPAQRAGIYAMQGVGLDGEAYTGNVSLRPAGPSTWHMVWSFADDEPITGMGIVQGDLLSAGYILDGVAGVAWYRIMPDGTLSGRWTAGDGSRTGTETLVPKRPS